jgi:hypothetical protein
MASVTPNNESTYILMVLGGNRIGMVPIYTKKWALLFWRKFEATFKDCFCRYLPHYQHN